MYVVGIDVDAYALNKHWTASLTANVYRGESAVFISSGSIVIFCSSVLRLINNT